MIRVIIERRCHPEKIAELERLLVDLRAKATRQPGYISGETLQSVDDPTHWLVISTWSDVEQWKAWETSAERKEDAQKVAPLLKEPERISVFKFSRRGAGASAHTIDR
jgi:quinol monooxygenase YgiN